MPPLARLAVLSLLFLSTAAEAQRPTRRILSRPWGTPPEAQTTTARATAAPVDTETSESLGDDAQAPAAEPVAPGATAPPQPQGLLRVYGRTGLRVSLPAGWRQAAADETRLPGYALYAFDGPVRGTVLRVEQVVGLNPLEEQQWRAGQSHYGYHGMRPVGPAEVPLRALAAFETAGTDTGGATAFVQSGRTFWTVSVEAPTPIWSTRKADVIRAMAAISIPAPAASAQVHAPGVR